MNARSSDWTGRAFGGGMVLVLVIFAVLAARILVAPFVLALFVAYLYEPVVVHLERRGLERGRAFLVLLAGTVALLVLGAMRAPDWLQMESMSDTASGFTERLQQQLVRMEQAIDSRLPMFKSVDVASHLANRFALEAGAFFQQLPGLAASFTINLLLVPFMTFFMIRDGRSLKRRVVGFVPNRYFETALVVIHRIDLQLGGYMRGRLIECIFVGVVQVMGMGIAALFVPQQHVVLISVVTGVTTMIPYVGPFIGAAFGVILYLGAGLPAVSVWALLIVSVVGHLLDNFVIAPAVLSQNVDLHPLTVMLTLFIGGEIFGVFGLLVAIPVAASLKVILQEVYGHYRLRHHPAWFAADTRETKSPAS